MAVDYEIVGITKAMLKLKSLERKVQSTIIRKAMRASANVVRPEAKALAPKKTGRMRKAIRIKAMKRKTNRIGINVIISGKDFKDGKTPFYPAFVQYGSKKRVVTTRNGKKIQPANRGSMPKNDFIGRAWRNKKRQASDTATKIIRDGVLAAIK